MGNARLQQATRSPYLRPRPMSAASPHPQQTVCANLRHAERKYPTLSVPAHFSYPTITHHRLRPSSALSLCYGGFLAPASPHSRAPSWWWATVSTGPPTYMQHKPACGSSAPRRRHSLAPPAGCYLATHWHWRWCCGVLAPAGYTACCSAVGLARAWPLQ